MSDNISESELKKLDSLKETIGLNNLTSTQIKPAMSVRLEIAKDLLAAMLSNPAFVGHTNSLPRVLRSREVLCEDALKYADVLISQESKPKN